MRSQFYRRRAQFYRRRADRAPIANPSDVAWYPSLYAVTLDDRGDLLVWAWANNVGDAIEEGEEYASAHGWVYNEDEVGAAEVEPGPDGAYAIVRRRSRGWR